MRLNRKLSIITAAASGMGQAGCELFAREGARVAAIDIAQDRLAAVVEGVKRAGGEVRGFVADLSDSEATLRAIRDAAQWLGGVDVLWNHAGLPGPGAVEGLNLSEYHKAMDVNVTAGLLATGEVAPHMRKRGGGSIVFTASIAGLVGSPFSPVYSAAKFAVVGLAKSLAIRYAPENIRVNAICPGPVSTPMLPQFVGRDNDPAVAAENHKRLLAAVPMGRTALASEIAQAALWLASDEASYVTGAALPVDGGLTAR
jgi:NAD(P)-dependent dehydrogenase (short-subunit alcohol dehydrogenase family)